MKYLITFTLFFIIMTAFLLGNYNPIEPASYSAKDRKALSDLIEKSQEPKPVVLIPIYKESLIASLYSDYAKEKNPQYPPSDWKYKGHK